ncbi:hypothetical protein G7K71_18675 [Desulfofundulus sp. TPOSR]|uniref:hypothetical protein n=1 Tax=Desulfofundulus sp. TPOSR TaxID=2714340 RepID=UPI001409BC94|nr:hypothetical protein [Desulfofundulus sp. TPOSR]NHM28950.1 hypothetical protein [Desulfofundulus sp. TPOSR]
MIGNGLYSEAFKKNEAVENISAIDGNWFWTWFCRFETTGLNNSDYGVVFVDSGDGFINVEVVDF